MSHEHPESIIIQGTRRQLTAATIVIRSGQTRNVISNLRISSIVAPKSPEFGELLIPSGYEKPDKCWAPH